jgi:hypothetical protein
MHSVRRVAGELTWVGRVTFVLREDRERFYADEAAVVPLWNGKRRKHALLPQFGGNL